MSVEIDFYHVQKYQTINFSQVKNTPIFTFVYYNYTVARVWRTRSR